MPDGRLFCPCGNAGAETFSHPCVYFVLQARAEYRFYPAAHCLFDDVEGCRGVLRSFIEEQAGERAECESFEENEREESVLRSVRPWQDSRLAGIRRLLARR